MMFVRFLNVLFLGLTLTQTSFADWAFKNEGVSVHLDLDPIQDYQVPGRAGQDLRIFKGNWSPRKRIRVAVLDTGTDFSHPLLKPYLAVNQSECQAFEAFQQCLESSEVKNHSRTKISSTDVGADKNLRKQCEEKFFKDADGNGMPLDCHGWSVLGGENSWGIIGKPDFEDDLSHGTHVAGLIAKTSEQMGGNVEILTVQAIDHNPNQPIRPLSLFASPKEDVNRAPRRYLGDRLARGLIYAINAGAKVINLSLGWAAPVDSKYFRELVAKAQASGIIFVAAAGNDSTQSLIMPCAYPGVICVGAHGPDGAISHFSNFGIGVDVFAPGVDMLSYIPMDFTPMRYAGGSGLDYLSGTSQATPLVTAIVAEMLAQGISANEIRARLMDGSRKWNETTSLTRETPQTTLNLFADRPVNKWGSAGLVDVEGALRARPKPFIVLEEKQKIPVNWDGKSSVAKGSFKLRNIWAAFSSNSFKISMKTRGRQQLLLPQVKRFALESLNGAQWPNQGLREVHFELEMSAGEFTQSEALVEISVSAGEFSKTYLAQLEIFRTVSSNDPTALSIWNLQTDFEVNDSIYGIDETLFPTDTPEYFKVSVEDGGTWTVSLLRGDDQKNLSLINKTSFKIDGDVNSVRAPKVRKMAIDSNGRVGYVLEFYSGSKFKIERMDFLVLNDKGEKIRTFSNDGKNLDLPNSVSWISSKEGILPIWIGVGQEPNKQITLRDLWVNPDGDEKWQKRIYYLDRDSQLRFKLVPEGYFLETMMTLTLDRAQKNELRLLLSKAEGTVAKPSAVRRHFTVTLKSIDRDIEPIEIFLPVLNIRDYKYAPMQNLAKDENSVLGTFWFSKARPQELSMVTMDHSMIAQSQYLHSQTPYFDAALWVRSAYTDGKSLGAFVLTNSEIEFHDLKTKKVWSTSQQRYTFYDTDLMTSSYFPATVRERKSARKIPALYTTESTALNRGYRLMMPSELLPGELLFPVGLRFKSDRSCRPLDPPQRVTGGVMALDFICQGKFLQRYLLELKEP